MNLNLQRLFKLLTRWSAGLSVFAGVMFVLFSCISVTQQLQDAHTRNTRLVFLIFVSLLSFAACFYGVSCGVNGKQVSSRARTWLLRISFYGLFMLGPILLTWGHVFHVKAKVREPEMSRIASTEGIEYSHFRTYEAACDCLGVMCVGGWLLWLWCALVAKASQFAVTVGKRHSGSNAEHESGGVSVFVCVCRASLSSWIVL